MRPELLQERLLLRGKQKQFGHFYLFSGRPADLAAQKAWVETLIRRYWGEVEGRQGLPQNIRADADLLWLSPPLNDDEEVVDYKVEGVEAALATFLPYRGLKSQRRFIIIEDAHRLTPIISNKLLKTLEEPEGELSFLWLNPYGRKFLATIESRALNLTLSWPKLDATVSEQMTRVRESFQSGDYPLAQFLEDGKKTKFDPELLVEDLLHLEQIEPGDAQYQQDLLIAIKEWNEAERFNQPLGTRLQGLHYLLSQRFRNGR